MERLKNMSLKKSFFTLSFWCMLISVLLVLLLHAVTQQYYNEMSPAEVLVAVRNEDGTFSMEKQEPDVTRVRVVTFYILHYFRMFSCAVIPCCGMAAAGILFYRMKLKEPIAVLKMSAERIQNHDLDFSISIDSQDEMGELGDVFETMRAELLKTNRELWQQAEERKRLNAAFAHDLRNPIAVLKGTVQLMRQGVQDEHSLERLETYTLRIEQYAEAMRGIQKLEQIPVQEKEITYTVLRDELEDTARLFCSNIDISVYVPEVGCVYIDHGIFLNVAENIIANASRFVKEKLIVRLEKSTTFLKLTVIDDGPGFHPELIENGPRPFGSMSAESDHLGMGLYSSKILCEKHGGTLRIQNMGNKGAKVCASFQIKRKS